MLPKMLTMLPAFLAYFAVGVVLITVFFMVYVNVTPYDEMALIRQGNTAAILAYLVARYTVPHLAEDIPAGKVAPAIFVATLSLTVGLTNAACMTY